MIQNFRISAVVHLVVCLLLAVPLFAGLGSASAQVQNTGVGGTVTDSMGGALPGATVTVRNTDTNVSTTRKTSSLGLYQFVDLEAGTYELTVSAPGFNEEKSNPFTLLNGQPAWVNIKVKVGSVTEAVDVSESQTQLLNTTNNSVSFAIDNLQVENLPINERNLLELVALQPGISTENDGGTAQNSRGGFEVNGAPGLSNNILLDGVDATFGEDNGAGSGNAGTIGPVINTVGIGAIAEFRTTTSVPPAEFGRALGGILTINSKAGTNRYHGQAFEYFRNDVMDANNWTNKHTPGLVVPVPELRFHEFGANVGGPIIRNHAFFFLNYEGARENQGASHTFDVPGENLLINMKNPLAVSELRMMPQGNVYPHPSNLNFWMDQWIGNVVNPTVENTGLAHIDFNYGKHHDMVRFDINNQDQGIVQTPRINDTLEYPFRFYNSVIEDDWTLGPNTVNTFRFGFNRNDLDRYNTTYYTDPYQTTIILDGYFQSDTNVSHLHFLTTTYNLIDNFTYVKGRHQFVFGTDDRSLRSIRIQDVFSDVEYNSITTTFSDTAYQVGIVFGGRKHFADYQFSGYAQDSFRATSRLTLNYGLRYEKYTPLHGAFNVLTNDPFGPMSQNNAAPYMSENNLNFIPRVGFIQDLTGRGKLLFSGGFGLMFIPPQPYFYYDSSSVAPNLPFDSTLTKADVPSTFSFAFPISKNLLNSYEANPSLATGIRFGRTIANPQHPDEYAINWNAQLQYQVRKDLTVKAIYTAMRNMHGQSVTLPNQFAPGACPTTTTCTARPNPVFGAITYSQYWSRIWYDGLYLQASLRNRLAEGNVYYALASDIQTWGENNNGGTTQTLVQDLTNPDGSRGTAQGVARNRIRGDLTISPKLSGFFARHRATRWTLGGYSFQGVTQFNTGTTYNVVSSTVDLVHNGRIGANRPDRVPGVSLYAPKGTMTNTFPAYPMYLNPKAFDIATPTAQQRYGTLGFDAIYGPHQINFNASVIRTFDLHRGKQFRFRVEAFNAFNHANFGPPTVDVSSSQFGEITGRGTPRNLQLGAEIRF